MKQHQYHVTVQHLKTRKEKPLPILNVLSSMREIMMISLKLLNA